MNRRTSDVAGWAPPVTLVLSLIGLALSTYLTIAHFRGTSLLVCPKNTVLNCAMVTTSAQSYFLGIPVAILGLADYVVLTALNTPWAWRARAYWLHVARFALGIVSMCFVLWLVAAELVIIKHICLYCTGVHVVTFVLFIVLSAVCPAQLGWAASPARE